MSGPSGSDGGAPRLGSMFGRYRIESVVGRGGMGVVMRATDTELDRIVALKFLAPELRDDRVMRERFMREPRLAAAIEHPNIVPIHEAGVIDGVPFIAMRAIRGDDLATILRREAPLSTARTLAIVAQLADALDTAHRRGLVHRDVKPGNVLLEPGEAGAPERAWLTDFGLTRRLGDASALTLAGPLGTIDYLAPELIAGGEIGPWTDQYSLACLTVHCLTGSPPWDGPTDAAVLHAHVSADRTTLTSRIPDARIAAALARALAPAPADRFPDCRSFARAMSESAGGDGAGAAPAGPALASTPVGRASGAIPVVAAPRRRGIVVAVAVALAALLGGAGLLALATGGPGASPSPSPSPSVAPSPSPSVTAVASSSPSPSPSVPATSGIRPSPSPSASFAATAAPSPSGVVGPLKDGVIVFAGGEPGRLDLYAIAPDGTGQCRLTRGGGNERFPEVTDNGRSIVYTAGRLGERDIMIMDLDGGPPRRLTQDPADDYAATVSPDGRRIAWTSTRDGSHDIFLMTDDGDGFKEADAVNLIRAAGFADGSQDVYPAWSRDGRWIVFSSNRGPASSDIVRLDPALPEGSMEFLTSDAESWADGAPTVDGQNDVWLVGTRGHVDRELYEIPRSDPIRRTTFPDDVILPDVGPDGKRVVAVAGQILDAYNPVDTRLVIFDQKGKRLDAIQPDFSVATDPDWAASLEGYDPADCDPA